jgi:hypothetical protein
MTVLTISAAFALMPAGVAHARSTPPGTNAAPGVSGVDEYVESVPTANGSSLRAAPSAGGGGESSLPAAARRQLAAQGADGQAVLALARGGAARESGRSRSGSGGRPGGQAAARAAGEAQPPASSDQPSTASALARALDGSGPGGMGAALPVIMAVSLLGAAALGLRRWRTGRR